jgi:GTP-binding protein HflX
VGYTNAGKSTLLNALTCAGILAEDKLFATLDPTTRQYVLPSGMKILLTDTVGFIRNLPHHLIKAFRSTLEEAALADVILHVCDASGEEFADELRITDNLLTELGASGKPVLLVFNKCDLIADREQKMLLQRVADQGGCEAVFISAKTGEGMDEFTEKLEKIASEGRSRVEFLIPYADGSALNLLHALAHDIVTEYADNGVRVTATVDAKTKGKLREYLLVPDTVGDPGEDEEDW